MKKVTGKVNLLVDKISKEVPPKPKLPPQMAVESTTQLGIEEEADNSE